MFHHFKLIVYFVLISLLITSVSSAYALSASQKKEESQWVKINLTGLEHIQDSTQTQTQIQNKILNSLALNSANLATTSNNSNNPNNSNNLPPKPTYIRLLYEQSTEQILTGLKAYGYYKANIDSHLEFNQKTGQYTATYQVNLGPPLLINTLDLEILGTGSQAPELIQIIQQSALKKNNILNQLDYEKLKSDLLNQALTLGYFDASFTQHEIRIDQSKNQAQVIVKFNTGTRYVFNQTYFTQTGYHFDQQFLSRYLPYLPKQPYDAHLIYTLQNRLNNTAYFQDLSVTPVPNKTNKTVDIHIETNTKKRIQYTLGLGYGTETGMRVTAGSNIRYINSRGDHFNITVQASHIYQAITAAYIIPGKNPWTDYTSLNAGQSYTNIIPYSATSTLVGADWGTVVGGWTRTLGLHENWIHYATLVSTDNRAKYLLPEADLAFQKRTQDGFYTNGYSADLWMTGTIKNPASQDTFIKSTFNTNYALGLGPSTRIFFRGQAGAIGTQSLTDLSPTLRFYTGGVGSVRGYQYSSLSPEDNEGNLTGGRYLLDGSINFEQRIYGQFSGLIFYDQGNAFNNIKAINFAKGAGIGFAYESPIGPIRLYFSHPINPPADQNSRWHIDFSVGTFI